MMRKILGNYEFVYNGTVYRGSGVHLGDTANHHTVKRKDFSAQVACLALKRTQEELGTIAGCRYWDITKEKLSSVGIVFKLIEIYFYPRV